MTFRATRTFDWQGAALGPDGMASGSLAPDEWVRPSQVTIETGYLVPVYYDGGRVRGAPGLLGEFAGLQGATDERVRAFAEARGMLGLCGHKLGSYHRSRTDDPDLPELESVPDPFSSRDALGTLRCRVASGLDHPKYAVDADGFANEFEYAEPIEAWRIYVLAVAGLLDYTASGRDDLDEWLTVNQLIMLLTAESGVAPYIDRYWDRSPRDDFRVAPPRLVMGASNVLAAVTTQVLYAMVGGGRSLAKCSGCAAWFAPRRRPKAGAANWCPDCRENGTSNRHYAERYRERRRASK